jgi:hypothetical protein
MTSRKARQRARAKGGTPTPAAPADNVSERSEGLQDGSVPVASAYHWAQP